MAYLVFFGLPVVLLVLGFPIFLILLVASIVAVLTVTDVPTEAIQTYMFGSLDNFPLLAVPFFILAGEIMAQGGIARRIIAMVMAIVGGIRGSLAVTTVAASELFGAMSHTAVGTVVAMGRMIYPALKEGGYNDRFAVGLIASSGAIAVVIPPSIAMILYAVSAEQSAILLFTAGILPSILIGIIDAAYVMSYGEAQTRSSWRQGTLGNDMEDEQGGQLVDRLAGRDIRWYLWRCFHAYGSRRRCGDLFPVRDHGRLPRSRSRWVLAYSAGVRLSHLANPSHRDLCGNLFVVANDQWDTAAGRRIDQCAANAEVGVAAQS